MDVKGEQVQELFNAGKLREISDYCRCDVLDTYFVFLRAMVMLDASIVNVKLRLLSRPSSGCMLARSIAVRMALTWIV